jgi:hypothetical protein
MNFLHGFEYHLRLNCLFEFFFIIREGLYTCEYMDYISFKLFDCKKFQVWKTGYPGF